MFTDKDYDEYIQRLWDDFHDPQELDEPRDEYGYDLEDYLEDNGQGE